MPKKDVLVAVLGALAIAGGAYGPAAAGGLLPREPSPFAGKIDSDLRKSIPSWPEEVKAPKGAPNVVVVLLDDVGFSASSVTGGPVSAPNLEQLAHGGLLYNNFHVNALCSPTRAALLSGRNSHQVGFGSTTEVPMGYPGYTTIWPRNAASVAEVLKDNGYSTAAFGKWHNTPGWETSPVGPFERWPTSLGFEYFYGFLAGCDSQWEPRLYRNTVAVEPNATPQQGYHLTTDLANDAITWLHQHDALAPEKPFFLYFATGATHSPHQVGDEWIAKYKGKFDSGWDEMRKQTFKRQKQFGIIPADAELTPRPKQIPAWSSLSSDQKKLMIHQAEVYAGFLEQTDYEVGRLLQAIRDEGQWDNTLVLFIVGDNGASGEGGPLGGDVHTIDGNEAPITERASAHLGSDEYFNNYAVGWAWGLDTPFQWTKPVSSHLGGTTDPLVVSWPAGLRGATGVRSQFQHVTDLAPTIYEAAGVSFPDVVNGVKQLPLEGKSIVYSFDAPRAPSRHTRQYFETEGNVAIYNDGWWAGRRSLLPWELVDSENKEGHPWELYNLSTDYSQAHNLAAARPEKLKEMTALFDSEARRNNVYPLMAQLFNEGPTASHGRTHFVFREGVGRIPSQAFSFAGHPSVTITADVTLPENHSDGVIIAQGGKQTGYTLYVKAGFAVFEVNTWGHADGKIVSKPLVPGRTRIVINAKFSQAAGVLTELQAYQGGGGNGVVDMSINGIPQGETKVVDLAHGYLETTDIGKDLGTPVSRMYESPFAFGGKIDAVTVDLN